MEVIILINYFKKKKIKGLLNGQKTTIYALPF